MQSKYTFKLHIRAYMHDVDIQAKQLLRRIEVRDLYNCSWKVRVPKMLPANQETDSHHPNDHPPNGRLWRAMEAMKLQPGGESIHVLLDETTKTRITVNDLWVEVCWH